jgi:hypothetical protein
MENIQLAIPQTHPEHLALHSTKSKTLIYFVSPHELSRVMLSCHVYNLPYIGGLGQRGKAAPATPWPQPKACAEAAATPGSGGHLFGEV